jgi:hypothetical protein
MNLFVCKCDLVPKATATCTDRFLDYGQRVRATPYQGDQWRSRAYGRLFGTLAIVLTDFPPRSPASRPMNVGVSRGNIHSSCPSCKGWDSCLMISSNKGVR